MRWVSGHALAARSAWVQSYGAASPWKTASQFPVLTGTVSLALTLPTRSGDSAPHSQLRTLKSD